MPSWYTFFLSWFSFLRSLWMHLLCLPCRLIQLANWYLCCLRISCSLSTRVSLKFSPKRCPLWSHHYPVHWFTVFRANLFSKLWVHLSAHLRGYFLLDFKIILDLEWCAIQMLWYLVDRLPMTKRQVFPCHPSNTNTRHHTHPIYVCTWMYIL